MVAIWSPYLYVQVCFPLIDLLIEQADMLTFGDLVNAVDTIAAPENSVLQVK